MRLLLFVISLTIFSYIDAQETSNSTFIETEITLKTQTGNIIGSLTIPNNGNTSSIVLIIAGSGPTDRDCNSAIGMKTNAFKMLSESFVKNGISTLRFDKRGVGKSIAAMASESELRFETYTNDVLSWISLLKADKRFSKIILLGHSEGSLIGILAAEQTKIDGFISIAGAGQSMDKILQEQLKTQLQPQLFAESNSILDSLRMGKTVLNVNQKLFSLYRPSVQPYMISWIKYDPAKEIKKLRIPVLIIQGTTDLQVKVNDAKLLSASKPDAKLIIIENMNHIMKDVDGDIQKNYATYSNPILPLKLELVSNLVDFIKK